MSGCHNLQKKSGFEWQNGDLLFQSEMNDSISDAIKQVTGRGREMNFSHVGMLVFLNSGKPVVLEAIRKGVCLTPLDSFLYRSVNLQGKPLCVVGRLKDKFQPRIPQAIEYGKQLLEAPYDAAYIMNNKSYYCSELIYEMMRHSGDFSEVFHLKPMTFKDPQTGDFSSTWVEYYRNLGIPIPEGEMGLNPNGMSQSPNIEIVYNLTQDK